MKNKIFFLIFLLIFNPSILIAEEYFFDVSNIQINAEGNIISAKNGKLISNQMNLEIFANKYTYIKDKDILKAMIEIILENYEYPLAIQFRK